MRSILCIGIGLVFFLMPAVVFSMEPTTFGGFCFGDPPREEMLCLAGPCTVGQMAIGHQHTDQLASVYLLPVSESQLGRVPISPPRYFFFHNRLLRIGFRINCEPNAAERCMTALAETLNEHYGMTLIRETYDSSSAQEASLVRHYHTRDGREVEIRRAMFAGTWERPYVDFNDPDLSDQLRLAANPNYRPHVH